MSACLLFVLGTFNSSASSHREAPLISNDPLADNVDLYAFKSPDNPNTITIIATYVPMQLPSGGPNYYSFGENVRYEIHVDNDASVPGDEILYRFTFNQVNEDPTTFFNIRLGMQNLKTTYTLERSVDGGASFQTIVTDGFVPPNNIGERSIESAVGLNTTYETLFNQAITTASTGEQVFAGPTDDPFFVDLGGIFDLGDAPRQAGKPVDGLACMNVSAIAIQVPISTLLKAGAPATPTNILDPDYVIGIWASASRPAMTTISSTADPMYSGSWVQVSRLGMPLTNEAVIPVGQKDFWNAITPYDEIGETTMDEYFFNPELALYMDDDLFGGAVPAFAPLRIQTNSLGAFDFTNGADGLFGLKGSAAVAGTALDDAVFGTLLLPDAGKPRSVDLWPAFHTGVPNVIPYQLATGKGGNPLAAGKPFVNNFLPNGGDMLRLNMAVPATDRSDANFSSLGLIQAAAIGLTVAPFNTNTNIEFMPNMDGFPNGRRLEDDVTRIELQAVSGVVLAAIGLWYDDFDANDPNASPLTAGLLNVLDYTTGVEKNDKAFGSTFPYLAMPHSGTGECSGALYKDPAVVINEVGDVYVSSNTQGRIGVFSCDENQDVNYTTFVNQGADADGIYYNVAQDYLIQLNRTNNTLDLFTNVQENLSNGVPPTYVTSSTSDFINGREIAVFGNSVVVAQDANADNGNSNKFYVYQFNTSGFTLVNTYDANINLWGIHANGGNLFAIEDNSDRLVVYNNFFWNTDGPIVADMVVEIDDMVRTHGLTYDAANDLMILTDVGDAASATDGAFLTVDNFMAAAADGVIQSSEQNRVSGPMSLLGNPVDVALNEDKIFIAERKTDGGRLLVFDVPTNTSDAAPIYNELFAGASAVHAANAPVNDIPTGQLFTSSNTNGMVGVFDVFNTTASVKGSFESQGMDADGIYYNSMQDILIQLNRTDNTLDLYNNVTANLNMGMAPNFVASSTSDFINGREIAVMGNQVVVAQDANAANGNTNKFYVYEYDATGFTLVNTYDADINLWGIHVNGTTLFAIEDNSDRLAVYNNFFANTDGLVSPDMLITIEDMVRTHGLTYDAASDLMILTDVGDAASETDGALIYVSNFLMAGSDGTITAAEQTRIAGPSTMLGNPVDVAYDVYSQTAYVAERKNSLLLGFAVNTTGGDVMPSYSTACPGVSAVYLSSTPNTCTIEDINSSILCVTESGTYSVLVTLPQGNYNYLIDGEMGAFTSVFSFGSYPIANPYNILIIDAQTGCQVSLSGTVDCTVTAIELLDISGRVMDEGNQIYWATATETNNDYFEIMRSTDGVNFQSIAKIDGAGNSNTVKSYQYLDKGATDAKNYYRVDFTDYEGITESSNIIELQRTDIINNINVAPNPASDVININLTSTSTSVLQLQVFDVTGKLLIQQSVKTQVGSNTYSLNIAQLSKGVYFIKMVDNVQLNYATFMVK